MKSIVFILFVITSMSASASPKWTGLKEEYRKTIVFFDVISEFCIRYGKHVETYTDYRASASKLMFVADMGAGFYSEIHKKMQNASKSMTREDIESDCDELESRVELEAEGLRGDYEIILNALDAEQKQKAESWGNVVNSLVAALNAFSSGAMSAASMSRFSIPLPSGGVTFGARQGSSYKHYIVSTSSGTVQCRIPDSGFAFCR